MDDGVSALDHVPPERWRFDDDVTRVFDDMLDRSIPQLSVVRQLVFDLGRRFVRPRTDVVDLGCSRGETLAPFVGEFSDSVRAVGVEVSAPMLGACRERFADPIARGHVEILDFDLCSGYPTVSASLTLAVLTLQFVPVELRARVIHDVYRSTRPGSAFVLVEKVLGTSPELDALLVEEHEAMKRDRGYAQEAIDRKRLSLEGVLVPMTAPGNEALLRDAGFAVVEPIWRYLNFGAWIAVKEPGA